MVNTLYLITKQRIFLATKIILVGCLYSGNMSAEETSEDSMGREPVVVTATRTETPVSEVTRSVTVITHEEIQQQSGISRNLGDILGKTVPGLGPTTEALSNFGQTLRGRDFLVLIDGIPQSTALRSSSRDLNTIDVDAIERIEVVRGGTAAYGFGAAGGLIHIITKHASKKNLEGFSKAGMRFSTERFDNSIQWETTHRVSGTRNNFDYLVSGTYGERGGSFDSSGDRLLPDPLGVQGGLDDTDRYNILGKFGYNFDDNRQRVQFSVDRFSVKQDTNYTFGLGGDPVNGIKTPAIRGNVNTLNPGTENTIVGVDYTHRNLFGSRVALKGYYGDLKAINGKFPGFAQTDIRTEKFGSRLTIDTPLNVMDYDFSVIWGVDYLRDVAGQRGLDGPTVVPRMEQDAVAGFMELELPVSTYGLVRGGFRHEEISVNIDDIVNRGGTFVQSGKLKYGKTLFNASAVAYLTEGLEAFGSFHQSFSVADIGRAIRDANDTIISASQLASSAQSVDSYEIGLRGKKGRAQATVAGFYSKSNNGTTFTSDLSILKAPERIWGVESTMSFRIDSQWNTGGTVSWAEGEVDLDGDGRYDEDLPSTRISPVKLSGFLEYSPRSWWHNRLQALHVSNRNSNSTQFGGATVKDYTIVDLTSRLAVGPGHLTIAFKNLLNADYFPLVSQASASPYAFVKGPGRIVGFTYAFNW